MRTVREFHIVWKVATLFLCISLGCVHLVVDTGTVDCLDRLISEVTCFILSAHLLQVIQRKSEVTSEVVVIVLSSLN